MASRLGVAAADTPTEAAVRADFVFEAIAENVAAKRQLLSAISTATPDAIIASNTSSILPSVLAAEISNPSRFVIAHFFNPAIVVPLVEIVPAPTTAPDTVDAVQRLLEAAGKEAVVLRREIAGFVANRLQAALLREVFALERDNIVSFEDADRIVRAGLGPRWAAAGPIGVVDLGGLDIWQAVTTRLFPLLAVDALPPAALTERVVEGELGAKTGRGFYLHDPAADIRTRERIAAHFALEFDIEPN